MKTPANAYLFDYYSINENESELGFAKPSDCNAEDIPQDNCSLILSQMSVYSNSRNKMRPI